VPGPIDEIVELARAALSDITAQLLAGEVSLPYWQRECAGIITRHFGAAYIAGLGHQPTDEEWREMGRELNRQLMYLRQFADAIKAGGLSDAQVAARIVMYADRLRGITNQGVVDALGLHLPQVPGDGNTECLTNCLCSLDIKMGKTEAEVTWVLDGGEHCPDCVRLASEWNPLIVPLQ
jgi:hypothetical protein